MCYKSDSCFKDLFESFWSLASEVFACWAPNRQLLLNEPPECRLLGESPKPTPSWAPWTSYFTRWWDPIQPRLNFFLNWSSSRRHYFVLLEIAKHTRWEALQKIWSIVFWGYRTYVLMVTNTKRKFYVLQRESSPHHHSKGDTEFSVVPFNWELNRCHFCILSKSRKTKLSCRCRVVG